MQQILLKTSLTTLIALLMTTGCVKKEQPEHTTANEETLVVERQHSPESSITTETPDFSEQEEAIEHAIDSDNNSDSETLVEHDTPVATRSETRTPPRSNSTPTVQPQQTTTTESATVDNSSVSTEQYSNRNRVSESTAAATEEDAVAAAIRAAAPAL